jgi:hypothetical protein
LCEVFPYRWQSIVAANPAEADKPEWATETRYPLRPRTLWQLWQDATQLVGVRFGSTTQYALVDIDAHSQYLNPEAIAHLKAALETIGICRSLIIRSSWNGGIHLYLPLPEAVPTWKLAVALKQCLLAQGFTIAAGQLELFPNCKPWGNPRLGQFTEYQAHRLPLQPDSGSILLDSDLQPLEGGLAQFFDRWDQAAQGQDIATLVSACTTAQVNRKSKHRPRQHNIVDSWRTDMETEIIEGWTAPGQTNHLLKTIACYGVVFGGYTGDALAEYVQRTAIACPGYEQWCRHQHEISLRAQVWARAAEGYYWALGAERTRASNSYSANNIVPFNQMRSEDAQARITAAVQEMEQQDTLPTGATERGKAIAQQAHVSSRTLYKYPQLWHPEHFESQQCKTYATARVVAAEAAVVEERERSLEIRQSNEFYTGRESMKGAPFPLTPVDVCGERSISTRDLERLTTSIFCFLFSLL